MKTANEMWQFCLQNNFDQNWDSQTALKHLKVIEQNLQIDEHILMCFVGKREVMNGKCAFAITNKHICWGQQTLTSQWHKEILFNTISNITFSKGLFSSMISFNAIGDFTHIDIDTLKVTSRQSGVTCSVKNKTAQEIYNKCKITFENAKEKLLHPQTNINLSFADEILKYKKLLDVGAVTQEEFEKKKQQLLNL